MIKASKLTKIYYTDEVETTAVNAVNFQIQPNEFVAIKGPSGCGKSTLLNLLGLLDSPSAGDLEILGQNVTKLNELQRTRMRKGKIGFIFQKFDLIESLNVFSNVELPLLYLDMEKEERTKRVNEILQRLSLSHRAKHFPAQLSGGQQQRVAVARCFVSNPDLILADEPTGNLDSQNGLDVMNLLKEFHAEGKTIIMVTHDDKFASFAQRTIKLLDGQIV